MDSPEISTADLNELSKKKLIKKFAVSDSIDYEMELFKRLESNEFSDAEIVEICMLLIEKRELEENYNGGD